MTMRSIILSGELCGLAKDEENDLILKDSLAIDRMCNHFNLSVATDNLIAKIYVHILARADYLKDVVKKISERDYTEEEKRYLATPEANMTLAEYRAAHPEDFGQG